MRNCLCWRYFQHTGNQQKIHPHYCLDQPFHFHCDLPFCIGCWSGLDLHTLNSTFPKLGTHFAHAWYRISCNFVFYRRFVLLDHESEIACHLLKLGLCLGDSCWARLLVALPSSKRLSYLRTPYVPAPSIEKYLRPSVGLASVRVAATLLARDFQWRTLFVSDHVIWLSRFARQRKCS